MDLSIIMHDLAYIRKERDGWIHLNVVNLPGVGWGSIVHASLPACYKFMQAWSISSPSFKILFTTKN